jgi:hypothetical protein
MKADVTWRTTVREATVMQEALTYYWSVLNFNSHAVAATVEERNQALGERIELEGIMRQLGMTVPEPTHQGGRSA